MKILVRATNWVGDAILSIPALEAIRARWKEAEIVILAKQWVADLYCGQPFADRVLVFDAGKARALRGEKFDCAVLLSNSFASAWLAWRAGIAERIGYARDGRSLLLTRAIAVPKRGEAPPHEVYYYLELLRRAGWLARLPQVEEIRLHVAPEAREHAERRLRAAGSQRVGPRVALAPGAAYGPAKCWLPERFAEVADRLIADFCADVIFFGSASETELARKIGNWMRHPSVDLTGQTAIGELPALLSACDLFIGNDSGAMHVAAAAGLPVVTIFGPSDPAGTAAVAYRRAVVRHAVECNPCFLRQCPVDHRCMTRISADEVYAAVRAWVESIRCA